MLALSIYINFMNICFESLLLKGRWFVKSENKLFLVEKGDRDILANWKKGNIFCNCKQRFLKSNYMNARTHTHTHMEHIKCYQQILNYFGLLTLHLIQSTIHIKRLNITRETMHNSAFWWALEKSILLSIKRLYCFQSFKNGNI